MKQMVLKLHKLKISYQICPIEKKKNNFSLYSSEFLAEILVIKDRLTREKQTGVH